MYTSTLLTLALAALSTAAPAEKRQSTYYAVSLRLITSAGLDPVKVGSPSPQEMNKLVLMNGGKGISVSGIEFDGSSSNVDINSVECRAYKDADGVIPGSAPFTLAEPAMISTNLDTVSSILCYVRSSAEYQ